MRFEVKLLFARIRPCEYCRRQVNSSEFGRMKATLGFAPIRDGKFHQVLVYLFQFVIVKLDAKTGSMYSITFAEVQFDSTRPNSLEKI